MTNPKSVTQARKCPESIVPKQDESAIRVTKGPRTIMTIPVRKIAVLIEVATLTLLEMVG